MRIKLVKPVTEYDLLCGNRQQVIYPAGAEGTLLDILTLGEYHHIRMDRSYMKNRDWMIRADKYEVTEEQ